MNEVNKIHLGRQAFTIAVDAHHELKSYLDAIKKQVGDKDVVEEVELRMAELLSERGISANKVILAADVDYLKTQLGNPKDFSEEGDEVTDSGTQPDKSKRLFRDTDNAMIAGVASGLAQYFGIDVLLIRILFIVAVLFTFGWGILLYIILWLLVPEARSSSDRLRMAGKPVNVDSLKEIAERADVKGAAHRASSTLATTINSVFSVALKIASIIFVLFGLSALFALISGAVYFIANNNVWVQYNIFPVGFREHLLLGIAGAIVGLIAVFIILFGVAMFQRKWPIRSWVTGILVGLIFIGFAVGGALAGDVYPNIRDRYNANVHNSIRTVAPFTALDINGPLENINFQTSNTYSVGLSYFDHPNVSQIKTIVQNKTLLIDNNGFDAHRDCKTICIPNNYNLSITIYAPDAWQLSNDFNSVPISPLAPFPPPKPFGPYN